MVNLCRAGSAFRNVSKLNSRQWERDSEARLRWPRRKCCGPISYPRGYLSLALNGISPEQVSIALAENIQAGRYYRGPII